MVQKKSDAQGRQKVCTQPMHTAHTCTGRRCAGSSSHHFKDTLRAMGIHDASGPNLRVQDISRRRLRGPES